jgi:hypothetical protein
VKGIVSLCWQNDYLIDWVSGGKIVNLDGSIKASHVAYSYRFDAALMSPSGEFTVLYERLGTKGLILQQGKIIREINRSFYYAHAYEYPVAFIQLADGTELLAHCSQDYCRLDIEEVSSGKCLTDHVKRKPADFFHSRLMSSGDGRWLVSAGWVWQPFDCIAYFDIVSVLNDATFLDKGLMPASTTDLMSAAFLNNKILILTTADDQTNDEVEPTILDAKQIGYFNLHNQQYEKITNIETTIGSFMPIGNDYIVSFFEYPKLIHANTGEILYEWRNLLTGKQNSSIIWHIEKLPPLAIDTINRRFAIADTQGITMVSFN